MALTVDRLRADGDAWDRFVLSSPDGTVFHLSAWKRIVAEVFRHTPHYLVAIEDEEIRGVLPLFEVRGLLTGRVLVSTPYAAYGGLCGADPAARSALLDRAGELAAELGSRYVELRTRFDPIRGLPTRSSFVTFVKRIDPDPDANFAALSRKRRHMIRRGIRDGLEGRTGWEPLADFHDLYARNRRRLGSPPFPRRLFERIRDELGERAGLLTIWRGRRMVAGVLSLYYRDQVIPYYGASRPGTVAVNDFMYWELMRAACLEGRRVFDFGQSHAGSGTYDFKRHWGFEPVPVPYQYLSATRDRVPDLDPSSATLRALRKAWRFLPLAVTRRVGPFLIRRLPLH